MTGIGISGTGRIGRLLIRKMMSNDTMKGSLKVINSTYPAETVAHLLKYDSVHGKWNVKIEIVENALIIDGQKIIMGCTRNPEEIPWKENGVTLVLDATGKFNDHVGSKRHLAAGAESVIITAPGKEMDATIVMGVNQDQLNLNEHKLISAASCTTNCTAPVLKVLDDAFGIKQGWLTTVHAFTSDQKLLDNPHKDLRRARSATSSIVPTSTGVGKALKEVIPHLAPVMQGTALRVPTQDVSLIDLTVQLKQDMTVDEVKEAFLHIKDENLSKVVGTNDEPLVSIDFVGSEYSAVVDLDSIMVMGDQLKVMAWYDNEWAYASRVCELAILVQRGMEKNENSTVLV
ncbi:type I glyceraldehyde-3-phosphate dehydrogenase [Alkalihalobacillus pseudalcaliphilus]|uniref:type I glyceraldehyde-3-phosphate dehydrogenase n=1 Tax=Alkalihalobacillus pseudalcaliphilus TaxID=79884 RepID=UPI00064E00D5|nr:type I glyceraldehyde-3-phosphate dehydrogenase [Alkalihalobacillus pseudalcaliphilus]KMK77037.1 glyceraldehyde-3-phosphate dehydrogenase [Alkalihalobacillus pseudalcaliphilus]